MDLLEKESKCIVHSALCIVRPIHYGFHLRNASNIVSPRFSRGVMVVGQPQCLGIIAPSKKNAFILVGLMQFEGVMASE